MRRLRSLLALNFYIFCFAPYDDGTTCGSRVGPLIKRILGQIVKDRIVERAYEKQKHLPCEGCEEHWANQEGHACLFFCNMPEYRVEDFVSEHYDNVMSSMDVSEIIKIFYAVSEHLTVGGFSHEGSSKQTLNDLIQDVLMSWENETDDITETFNSYAFPNVTRLIDFVLAAPRDFVSP